ncbi:hypothetical protein CBR_g56778 [Chara braunii]|uniref:DDE-1 domain-containing protein n=1 Tax=Chara braunii TaxID=69332 RepID=A0A388MDX0_CHABU|nr:hypothetical protein CBR_g56778 [Chara braunii]|eukprot:GBG92695.1 hypothetical protein CBR_g56778 [Chara braunii]
MWSDETITSYLKNVIECRRQTAFERQHVLLLIDSYGPHLKLRENSKLQRQNIHVFIISPCLPNLLQPLDVAINRSFQQHYSRRYEAYIQTAIEDTSLQTTAGNPRCPSYQMVADWVCEWVKTKTREDITNSFHMCRLVSKAEFTLDKLHALLKVLFDSVLNMDEWNDLYGQEFTVAPESMNLELLQPPEYFIPYDAQEGEPCSFWQCLHRAIYGSHPVVTCKEFRHAMIEKMKGMDELADITDSRYFAQLHSGGKVDEDIVGYAVSQMGRCTIRIQDAADSSFRVIEPNNPAHEMNLVCVNEFYVLKL